MSKLTFYVPIILAAAAYAARMAEIATKRNTIPGPVQENLTFRLFFVVGTAITFGSLAEYLFVRREFSWLVLGAGVACSLVSFALRRSAIAALGKFWSLHVEIRENHEFVQSGPFRFMRHPTYFSMVLELLSFALIFNAWITMIFIPLAYIPVLIMRLRLEEPALVEKFGDAYREYQRRVPMLIPYKWPSR